VKLWSSLRDRRLMELKFRRQHPLGFAVPDFYCAERKLIVELDGAVHLDREQQVRDRARDEELRSRGWTILRLTNDEIQTAFEAALQRIAATAAPDPDKSPAIGPSPTLLERGARRAG
jgi:very-short-patch-repair endonuclease